MKRMARILAETSQDPDKNKPMILYYSAEPSITLDGGKRYTQTVERSFHISMAALEPPFTKVGVMVNIDKAEYLLCSLGHQNLLQQPLDLMFTEGEEVTFFLNGNGVVHLTGYLVDDQPEGDEDFTGMYSQSDDSDEAPDLVNEGDDDDDDSDEDDVAINKYSGTKRKKKEKKSMEKIKKKKVMIDNSDDDDDDEDDENDFLDDLAEESDDEDVEDDSKMFDSDDDEMDSEEEEELKEMLMEQKKKLSSKTPDKGQKQIQNKTKTPKNEDPQKKSKTPTANETPSQKKSQKKSKTPSVSETPSQKTPKTPSVNETPNNEKTAQENSQTPGTEGKKKKKKKKKRKSEADATLDETTSPKPQAATPSKKVLNGGTLMEEVKQGHGPEAKPGKMVSVYYTGRLASNGKQFDSCSQGKPFKFRLGKNEVIKGWDTGLAGMKVGGKRKLTIPPQQAYGNQKMDVIPPNSTLVFDVELKAVS